MLVYLYILHGYSLHALTLSILASVLQDLRELTSRPLSRSHAMQEPIEPFPAYAGRTIKGACISTALQGGIQSNNLLSREAMMQLVDQFFASDHSFKAGKQFGPEARAAGIAALVFCTGLGLVPGWWMTDQASLCALVEKFICYDERVRQATGHVCPTNAS